jgi:hypothetical protein
MAAEFGGNFLLALSEVAIIRRGRAEEESYS